MAKYLPEKAQKAAAAAWLKRYYFIRFAFSAAWVAIAFTLAKTMPVLSAALLVGYPAWDAIANYIDAQRTGGLGRNKSQFLNFVVSVVTTAAVALALGKDMASVIFIFGIWAILSGLFQLITGVGRWKSYGAQWAMILSGAQSVLAGGFMVKLASGAEMLGITTIAPYAAFGAFYFLGSAIWLTVSDARNGTLSTAN